MNFRHVFFGPHGQNEEVKLKKIKNIFEHLKPVERIS